MARQVAKPGGDWVVLHLQGEPYTHKPPLVPWIGAALHAAGMDLARAVRIPSLIGSALAVLGTFLVGRRLYGERAGIAAAFVLATAAEFAWIGRRAQYDPLLTGFTTLALWTFVRSRFPREGETPRPWRDALLGGLFVGLAGMCKGPAALAFTALPVVAFAAVARETRTLLTARLAAVVAASLLPAAIWLAAAADRAGIAYARDLVLGHGVGHAAGDVDKQREPWFYLFSFSAAFLPWSLFLPAAYLALTRWRGASERRGDLFLLAWFASSFLVMSAIPPKRDLYLLPLYPAAALAVGKLAQADAARLAAGIFRVPRIALGVLGAAAGTAAALVGLAVLLRADGFIAAAVPAWRSCTEHAGMVPAAFAVVAGSLLAYGGARSLRMPDARSAFGALQAGALAATLLAAQSFFPAADAVRSPRAFYERAAVEIRDAPLLRYGVDDFAPHWTLRRDKLPYARDAQALARQLASAGAGAYVVAERETIERKGLPDGLRPVLEWSGASRGKDLVLFRRD